MRNRYRQIPDTPTRGHRGVRVTRKREAPEFLVLDEGYGLIFNSFKLKFWLVFITKTKVHNHVFIFGSATVESRRTKVSDFYFDFLSLIFT